MKHRSAGLITDRHGILRGELTILVEVKEMEVMTLMEKLKNGDVMTQDMRSEIVDSYKLMDVALDSILNGLMIIDTELRIKKFNHKICELFQMDEAAILKLDMNVVLKEIDVVGNILINKRKFSYSDITLTIGSKQIDCFLDITPVVFNEKVMGAVLVIRESKQVRKEINKLAGFRANYTFDKIITKNKTMLELINTARRIAKTNCSVLIEGESGTGKELFAQSIHNDSQRRNGPFIAINCAAIPKELVESEFFGYETGSFTGAIKGGMPGKFELANGGTLFLDEIGEIPLEMQPKLLRVLDENKVMRIGGSFARDLDVRIIAATNRNLLNEMSKSAFRQDLYFRLNVINLRLLPLKRRPEDILVLGRYFLEQLNCENSDVKKFFSKAFEEKLLANEWKGNVRELKNMVERGYYLSAGVFIDCIEAPTKEQNVILPVRDSDGETLRDLEKNSIEQALFLNKGNAVKAAEDLCISRATIYRKIKAYDIHVTSL